MYYSVTGVTQRVTRLTGRIKKCVRFNTLRTLLDVLKSCGNAVRRALHVDTSQASRGGTLRQEEDRRYIDRTVLDRLQTDQRQIRDSTQADQYREIADLIQTGKKRNAYRTNM